MVTDFSHVFTLLAALMALENWGRFATVWHEVWDQPFHGLGSHLLVTTVNLCSVGTFCGVIMTDQCDCDVLSDAVRYLALQLPSCSYDCQVPPLTFVLLLLHIF